VDWCTKGHLHPGRQRFIASLPTMECPVCAEIYAERLRRPRSLLCGHTFCEACLHKQFDRQRFLCPTCRAVTPMNSISDLPINFIAADLALQYLQRQKQSAGCVLHPGELLRFFCNTCTEGMCAECIIGHSGHFFVKYDESVQVLKNKAGDVQRAIAEAAKLLDDRGNDAIESLQKLDSKATEEVSKIDSEFEVLKAALHARKEELIEQFHSVLALEEQKIAQEIEDVKAVEAESMRQKRNLAEFAAELANMTDLEVTKRLLTASLEEITEQIQTLDSRLQAEGALDPVQPEFIMPMQQYKAQIASLGKVVSDHTDMYEIQQPLLCFFGDKNQVMTFDLTTKQWDLRTLFSHHDFNYYAAAVTLPDGSALVTGGGSSASVLHYKDRKVVKKANMTQIRKEHASVYLCGCVYVIGGYDGLTGRFLHEGEKYNLLRDEWSQIAPMNVARCAFSATSVNSKLIFIFGGYDGTIRLSSIEKYDHEEDKWQQLPITLRSPLSNSACFSPRKNQVIILGGGLSTGFSLHVQLLDIETGQWVSLPPMAEGRDLRNKVCYYGGKVYCVGGYNFKAEAFAVEMCEWEELPNYLVGDNLDSWSSALIYRRSEKK